MVYQRTRYEVCMMMFPLQCKRVRTNMALVCSHRDEFQMEMLVPLFVLVVSSISYNIQVFKIHLSLETSISRLWERKSTHLHPQWLVLKLTVGS